METFFEGVAEGVMDMCSGIQVGLEGSTFLYHANCSAFARIDSATLVGIFSSQVPVIEQAIETAALMLGTDKSRGYCLEMICADFLAGANLENENPEVLLRMMLRFFGFLSDQDKQTFLQQIGESAG